MCGFKQRSFSIRFLPIFLIEASASLEVEMFKKSESGQGFVEYALIIVFIALAVIVVLAVMGPQVRDAYNNVINTILNYTP